MPERQHRLDRLIRIVAGTPVASRAARDQAERDLSAAMSSPPVVSPRRPTLLLGLLTLLVLVVVVFLVQAASFSPAAATINQLAEIAEQVGPVEARDASFVYTRSTTASLVVIPKEGLRGVSYDSDHLVYEERTIRESWIGTDGTVQISITVLDPMFLSDNDRATYYAAGINEQDQVGETVTSTISQAEDVVWPSDPNSLDEVIRRHLANESDLPQAVKYLNMALGIIRESHASPDLRAATMRLVGTLDDLELLGVDDAGTATFSISFVEQGIDKTQTFSLDTSGYVRLERTTRVADDPTFGIPAQTVESQWISEQPRLVSTLDSP